MVTATKTVTITAEQAKAMREQLAAYRAANPSPSRSYGSTVTLVGEKLDRTKLAPQARIVLTALANLKGKASVQDLLVAMGKIWPTDRYRQGPKRIFFFYRKDLVEGKFITCS